MAAKYSLFIGIEEFQDPEIKKVGYAQKDAETLASVFRDFGYEADYQTVLINGHATFATVKYQLQQILRCAQPDDSILIFFSSHGYSSGSDTYLVCHDTQHRGLVTTAISLKDIFSDLEATDCKQVILMLDCCHAGLKFPEGEKGLLAHMNQDELKDFLKDSDYCVAFASCKDTEKSRWSDVLEHGVWTFALLEALSGKDKRILQHGRLLLSADLQDYLKKRVPELMRENFHDKTIVQTPKLFGSLTNSFLIADLGPLLEKQRAQAEAPGFPIADSKFLKATGGSIRDLSGFNRKIHKVPDYQSQATERFVRRIGSSELEEKANSLHKEIKEAFGYLRKDISVGTDDGSATIRAKDFDVNLELRQDDSEPSEYILTTEVSNFSSPAVIKTDEFNHVFKGEVSTLRIEFNKKREIIDFIDRVEEAGDDCVVQIGDYDENEPFCEFTVKGVGATFVLRENCLDVRLPGNAPKDMLGAFLSAGRALLLDDTAPKLLDE